MNKTAIFILLLILSGCAAFSRPTYVPSEKVKIASEIRKKAAAEIMVKTGLQPCGTGGQMMYQIKMLALSFDCKGPIQIDKARELLLQSVDILVANVNADERIRPYLHNYPFEAKNVEIRIFVRGRDRLDVPSGELSVISSIKGIFDYDIDDSQKRGFITLLEETYAEAKALCKNEENSSLPLKPG